MFCFHKYTDVDKDGYQYCIKCHSARIPGCLHDYELLGTRKIIRTDNQSIIGIKYEQRCRKCGDIKIDQEMA